MDFRLSDEQLAFQQHCHRFAEEVIRPAAAEYDREQQVPWDIIREARAWGLHGLDHIQSMATDERGPALASSTPRSCTGAAPASRWPSRRRRWPRPASPPRARPSRSAAGSPRCFGLGDEIRLGAYAVTEAGAGSDVKSLRTTARRDGDEWVLNGTKVFISNGGIADVNVVVATVDPALGHRGQASFVVEKGTPGLSMGKKEDKLGIRASQTAEVVLEDVRVPDGPPARRPRQARAQAGARPQRASAAAPPARWPRSRSRARSSARARSASRARRTSGRSTTSRAAPRPTAGRCSRSSASSRCSPTWPPRSRPRDCSFGGRRGWGATASR